MNPTPPKPPADALPDVKATPRTDAEIEMFHHCTAVDTDFARQLERELNTSREWCLKGDNEIQRRHAELTALRANAGEDSRLLDWLEKRFPAEDDGRSWEDVWAKAAVGETLRQAIRAAMAATTPPASLASGGEK